MKIHEYGNPDNPKIILLHPMLASASIMKSLIADNMIGDYFYIIPNLSGHGEDKTEFISAESEAIYLKKYLSNKGYTKIKLLLGFSLGAVVALQLYGISNEIDYETVHLDGCSLYEKAKYLSKIITFVLLGKQRKARKNLEAAKEKMSEIFGHEHGEDLAIKFISMSRESIKNCVRACSFVKIPEIPEKDRKSFFFEYGEKEFNKRKSQQMIQSRLSGVHCTIRKGYGHCEYLVRESRDYALMLEKRIQRVEDR